MNETVTSFRRQRIPNAKRQECLKLFEQGYGYKKTAQLTELNMYTVREYKRRFVSRIVVEGRPPSDEIGFRRVFNLFQGLSIGLILLRVSPLFSFNAVWKLQLIEYLLKFKCNIYIMDYCLRLSIFLWMWLECYRGEIEDAFHSSFHEFFCSICSS